MLTIVILGSGGHASVVSDAVRSSGRLRIAGFLDRPEAGPTAHGYPILGDDAAIGELTIDAAIVGLGDNALRARVAGEATRRRPGLEFVAVAHATATVAPGVEIGPGTVIMAGAIVNPGARIGSHCIVNTGACVEHDVVLGDFASVGPRAVLGGGVRIGTYSAVGIGATLSHGVKVGEHTVIGAGAVVVRDLPDLVVAYGIPCRPVRARKPGEKYL